MAEDIQKTIYQAFSPEPLAAHDPRYVQLDDARGGIHVVRELVRTIELSAGYTFQILAGHRGCGKTTELNKLPAAFSKKMFVVPVSTDADCDRNDLDLPDLLAAVIRSLYLRSEDLPGTPPESSQLETLWGRLKGAVGNINLDEINAYGLTLKMKASPEVRSKVREVMDRDADSWLKATNDLIEATRLKLAQLSGDPYGDIVIVIDDLDKMVVRPYRAGDCTTAENLFINRAAQLKALGCHVISTIPIDLAYSHHNQTLRQSYGDLHLLPMVKVCTRPPESAAYGPGIERMRSLIDARLKEAGNVREEAVFESPEVVDKLIKLAGGQPTELMTAIREAMIAADLPIQMAGVERVRAENLRNYRRMMRREYIDVLKEINETGSFVPDGKSDAIFCELLVSRAVLLYRNDDEWYALHPAVAEIIAKF